MWDVGTGECKAKMWSGSSSLGCWSVCFLSNSHFAAGYQDGSLKVWKLELDGLIEHQSKPHSDVVSSMCMVPGKNLLCTAPYDKSINVFSVDGGLTLKGVVLDDHEDAIHCIVSSASGMVASGGGETDRNCKDKDREIPNCSGVKSDKAIRVHEVVD